MRLEAHPQTEAARLALEVLRQTLGACRGDRLLLEALRLDGSILHVKDFQYDLDRFERVIVAGAGKASAAMAEGIEQLLGDRISEGLIITKYGHSEPLAHCRIIESGHPVPDENSLRAGREILDLAASVTDRDSVIFLLSGGASALMEAPVEGVSLSDLQAVNEELLACGAPIHAMNAIRARLSRIKGGGLAEAFKRSTNVVVYLSDVEGGLPAVVGSGPFISPSHTSEIEKALEIVQIEERFPKSVVDLIRQNAWSRSPANQPPHVMIGNAQMMRDIAGEVAANLGAKCEFLPPIQGEAKLYPGSITLPPSRSHGKTICQIAVGEPVVHRTGAGLGGRAQEMACAFAKVIEGRPDIAILVAGSDGTDGPTDAAGALVDGQTASKALATGFSVERTLADNDSYHFHEAAGSLIKTGPTGTNLNDIVIVAQATSGSD